MKTLIEIFSDKPLENVVSCFALRPKKVIYVGFEIPAEQRKILESCFSENDIRVKCEYVILDNPSLEYIMHRLGKIVAANDDCAIELGGGNELICAATGAVAVQKEIPLFRYNLDNSQAEGIYHFSDTILYPLPQMSIADGIRLHGGCINESKIFHHWNITDEFERDILGLWRIYSKDCTLWNKQMAMLGILDELDTDRRPEWVYVEQSRLKSHNHRIDLDRRIISQLCDNGYLSGFVADKNKIMYRYKNPQIRATLTKTGNLLELYTLVAAQGVENTNGRFFNDVRMGIFIDWDGVIHYGAESVKDTVNEVDITAMHGVIPVFISCKSGEVKKEALYELHSIAEKFGGSHAKKILVMTDMRGAEAKAYLKQRADDMGIILIENLHNKSLERFRKELLHASM